MGRIFCDHDWVVVGKTEHIRFNYDMTEVVKADCQCKKCGIRRIRKIYGYRIGNLFQVR